MRECVLELQLEFMLGLGLMLGLESRLDLSFVGVLTEEAVRVAEDVSLECD